MRISRLLGGLAVVCLSCGCQKGITGSWVADTTTGTASPIAHVSFVGDGTFTADAKYGGGTTHAVCGHYETSNGTLRLDTEGQTRSYSYVVEGDVLSITHEDTTARMNRVKPKAQF
jgi:hypothetical protein